MPVSPKPVRKAVIPAAGLGTRFLPASKAVPKEMTVIGDRPAIQWLVEEALAAGVTEVILVVSRDKDSIIRHFTPAPDLARTLRERGRPEIAAALERLDALSEHVRFVFQEEQKGLGHAVLCAEDAVGDVPFLVLLGDALVAADVPCARQLVLAREQCGGGSVLGLQRVPIDRVRRYGIVDGARLNLPESPELWRIADLVEKPDPGEAPSTLAIAGRYLLEPRVFRELRNTPPGVGGEIQLTDALRRLCRQSPMHGLVYRGHRYDIGSPEGYLAAALAWGRRDPRFHGLFADASS